MARLFAAAVVLVAVLPALASEPGQPLDCSDWVFVEPGFSCQQFVAFPCEPGDPLCEDIEWVGYPVDNESHFLELRHRSGVGDHQETSFLGRAPTASDLPLSASRPEWRTNVKRFLRTGQNPLYHNRHVLGKYDPSRSATRRNLDRVEGRRRSSRKSADDARNTGSTANGPKAARLRRG